jgi:cell division cycle 14
MRAHLLSSILSSLLSYAPGRLYHSARPSVPADTATEHFFSTDETLVYERFFADFGPLNLGMLYQYCALVRGKLEKEKERRVIHVCSTHEHMRANAAYLIGSYMIIFENKTPEEAYLPFVGSPQLIHFRDAAFTICTYNLTVLDCLRGVSRAKASNFLNNFASFPIEEYQRDEKIENGDFNWIMPGKLMAFSGPLAAPRETRPGVFTLVANDYVPIFKRLNVTAVVRFNNKCYDKDDFERKGIHHYELFYPDGGNPTPQILQRFLQICETEKGGVAVHCKAGLGRTGTNIGAYMMKHLGFSTAEIIAWSRICRPGSIVGPQQQYLEAHTQRIWKWGEEYTKANGALHPTASTLGAKHQLYQRPAVGTVQAAVEKGVAGHFRNLSMLRSKGGEEEKEEEDEEDTGGRPTGRSTLGADENNRTDNRAENRVGKKLNSPTRSRRSSSRAGAAAASSVSRQLISGGGGSSGSSSVVLSSRASGSTQAIGRGMSRGGRAQGSPVKGRMRQAR